ncbi:hypothetical protein H1O16_gp375 [Burkholderia phage BcepSaruman]|uniref:Uncharacterized protein n=1 Tax=Burkholderia phage BcepSaruman TaxID=2530032 RepID=A0A4D5ZI96_9CAUD|nr:hypothetical protein H1O16_gp375 [Burkholderia phage BcepSaruman]QBX06788.1 hypothetical protein BcepSaruman_375 [Burkholderia phage BcepSaruman]
MKLLSTGKLYNSSYSGCEGWSSCLVGTISLVADTQRELDALKVMHEQDQRQYSDKYTRREVVWEDA